MILFHIGSLKFQCIWLLISRNIHLTKVRTVRPCPMSSFLRASPSLVPDPVARNIIVKSFAKSKRGKQKSIRIDTSRDHHYRPSMYVDETGLTSDKYIHLNESVAALPLKISIGPMSSQRWLLMSVLEDALATQTSLGFSERDLDDIRRLVTETSLTFLLITMIASTLHLLFEYLAFRSDVKFWNDNKSLAGLSTRSLLTDLVSQVIVFLYLIESEASLLVIVPSFIGIVIQLWKVKCLFLQKEIASECDRLHWALSLYTGEKGHRLDTVSR